MKIKVKITTAGNMKYYGCAKDTIKEIEFEDYLKCVVASEIGNASIEACKAQAIACRTFACMRGVLDGKAISDDASKAQAFRADRTNYANCNAAVEATQGQVLVYDKNYIGAYFCHSNGGRTYSSKEVWGSDRPYLVARTDTWTQASGVKKSGHGIGLSQAGCKYAAANGIKSRDILEFYYPNTSLVDNYNKSTPVPVVDNEYERKVLAEIKTRVQLAMQEIKKGL